MQFFNQANEVGLKQEATILMGSQEVQSIQIIKTWKSCLGCDKCTIDC